MTIEGLALGPLPDLSHIAFDRLGDAARDHKPVSGWTHNFYRYPARFSPAFAAAAIEHFSRPGDLVLDPYMGGGTAIVEALIAGRNAVGNDLNSLAAFVTKVKTTPLTAAETQAVELWAIRDIAQFSYRTRADALAQVPDPGRTKNLSLSRARFIKKASAAALASLAGLPTDNARDLARCALLRVCQWALDGRKQHTSLPSFREKLFEKTIDMLAALSAFAGQAREAGGRAALYNLDTAAIGDLPCFTTQRANLVVTSPPYPGVHVLYHKWQVDGRRETSAPFWIAGCADGRGSAYYNFGDRRQLGLRSYFETSLRTLQAIRRAMLDGAHIVQLIAFSRPEEQLALYLDNMSLAGFKEVALFADNRIWRGVPNRRWHARLRGMTHAAREVVLVHQAT